MFNNTDLGADDKLFNIRVYCIFYNFGGAADEIGEFENITTTLGVC
jgi:hypothetical protein